jgi:protein-tyrosine phosphatase
MKKLGIEYVISCVPKESVRDYHRYVTSHNPGVVILHLPMEDTLSQNLFTHSVDGIKYPDIAYNFIERSNSNVLVHCHAGISRSVSIVIYYIMKKYKKTYDEALILIRRNRPIANPNPHFAEQLKIYG